MKRYDFFQLLKSGELKGKKAVITIGVFDGVHLGHRSLMNRVVEEAQKSNALPMCITFSINPKTTQPRNVDTLRIRAEEVEKLGLNSFVVIDFSPEFSRISAGGFIDMLLELCQPMTLVVGEDFRFGHPDESASAQELESMFRERDVDCRVIIENAILTEGGEKISSTLVRRVIEKGETGCIPTLTGRKYRVDLMPCPFRIDDGVLVICTKSIHQLLPPPGAYDATLKGKASFDGICRLEGESLKFTPYKDGSLLGLEKDGVQLDSIFFGEKK